MSVLVPERSVEDVIASWRRGEDLDGLESPAGPRYSGDFAEHEITMTGGSTGATICGTWCTVVISPYACC